MPRFGCLWFALAVCTWCSDVAHAQSGFRLDAPRAATADRVILPNAANRLADPTASMPMPPNQDATPSRPTPRDRVGPQSPQPTASSAASSGGAAVFNPLLIEPHLGYSYLVMALGRRELPSDPSAEDLEGAGLGDVVDSIQGGGLTVGGTVSMRLAFLSLGMRVSYSSYAPADVLSLMGEAALRLRSGRLETRIGFGLGGGWLMGVEPSRVRADSGLAMRLGLGLTYMATEHLGIGIGVDAVGLFLADRGISPSQIGGISMDSDHPIGLQIPVHVDLSVRL